MLRAALPILILPLLAASSAAGESRLPVPDPPGVWRWMTHDDATTTSKCIGDFSSAICAMETVFACRVRGRSDLCAAALAEDYLNKKTVDLTESAKYRINRVQHVVRKEQAMDRRGVPIYDWHKNDLRVDVDFRECYRDRCHGGELGDVSYFLRWRGKRWVVENWADLKMPF